MYLSHELALFTSTTKWNWSTTLHMDASRTLYMNVPRTLYMNALRMRHELIVSGPRVRRQARLNGICHELCMKMRYELTVSRLL